jgi:hypothetical protein
VSINAFAPAIPQTTMDRFRRAATDGWIIAVRDLTYWIREPARVAFMLMYPISRVESDVGNRHSKSRVVR